ncbi:chemotaxis protein CheY [Paenibacillus algicola]|uniref:Chemotaxis protein CheY n=1 Tax=Paenibacillus algicola TaxID=2565926 RepID=A0A4V1G3G1_9BACL|nr:helix-turn-helix domain-containing protein [Paenibacillus algicola]QCT01074.1 chemotaxis protein CheY [Paenibacillus algicola]
MIHRLLMDGLPQTMTKPRNVAQEELERRRLAWYYNHLLKTVLQGETAPTLERELYDQWRIESEDALSFMLIQTREQSPLLQKQVQESLCLSWDQLFTDSAGRLLVILKAPQAVDAAGEQLYSRLASVWPSVLIAISPVMRGRGSIHALYASALKLLLQKQYEAGSGFISGGRRSAAVAELTLEDDVHLEAARIEKHERELFVRELEQVLRLTKKGVPDVVMIRLRISMLELEVCSRITQLGGDGAPLLERLRYRTGSLEELSTYRTLKAYGLTLYDEAAVLLDSLHEGKESSPVEQAISRIDQEYRSGLQLQELARAVHVNPNYLGYIIKRRVGVSFKAYIHSRRIEEAKRLLRHTGSSIHQIAMEVGYSNADYFIRMFKRTTGLLPTVYRQQ